MHRAHPHHRTISSPTPSAQAALDDARLCPAPYSATYRRASILTQSHLLAMRLIPRVGCRRGCEVARVSARFLGSSFSRRRFDRPREGALRHTQLRFNTTKLSCRRSLDVSCAPRNLATASLNLASICSRKNRPTRVSSQGKSWRILVYDAPRPPPSLRSCMPAE